MEVHTILLAEACLQADLTKKATHASSRHQKEAPTRDLSSRCVVLEVCEATAAQFALLLNEVNLAISRVVKEADTLPIVVVEKTTGALTTDEEVVTMIMTAEALQGTEESRAATRLFRSLVEAVAAPVPAQTLKQRALLTSESEQTQPLKWHCERLPRTELFKPLGSKRK